MTDYATMEPNNRIGLRRALSLRDLLIFGIVIVQPSAPLPIFGVIGQTAQGHVVLAVLLAMGAMLFTAISYGRMAHAYPIAGSAYTYVGREIHPLLGQLIGWAMALDYLMNPLISIIWCSLAIKNIVPALPYSACAIFFAMLFTLFNVRSILGSAHFNRWVLLLLCFVLAIFFVASFRYLSHQSDIATKLLQPFYDPQTFSLPLVLSGTSIAALTYIGFDGVSTLSEEAKDPRKNILLAMVLTCVITGALSSLEVYVGQLVWPEYDQFPNVETAFSYVAGRAGGPWLFHLVNLTLLIATAGAGTAAQLAGARLLYAMGRENVLPEKFFGALEAKRRIPQNNVLLIGAVALIGALTLDYQLGAEMLNFGAFLAFMGVNISALLNLFRSNQRNIITLALPVLGFALCFYLWLNLSHLAKVCGLIWLGCGIVYGYVRWKIVGVEIKTLDPQAKIDKIKPLVL